MANTTPFESAKIPLAVKKNHHKNFTDEHITSADFCDVSVAKAIRISPKMKVDINFRAFARLAPLSVPTFGRANMNVRAFFVPYRAVWSVWDNFITDSPFYDETSQNSAIATSCPQIDNLFIVRWLAKNSTVVTGTPTSSQYDFCSNFKASDDKVYNTLVYYKCTASSARVLKLLHSLGYAPQFWITDANGAAPSSGTAYTTYVGVLTFNLLPLISFVKVFADWYYPSQYQNTAFITLMNKLTYQRVDGQYYLDYNTVNTLIDVVTCIFYDADYFTGAFDNPAGPASGNYSNVSIPDITVANTSGVKSTVNNSLQASAVGSSNGTPTINTPGANVGYAASNLSDYALHALRALTSYARRHQLAGSRALDRYLARFGISLNDEKLHRSIYLGNHEIPLMTGDVMSTAETGSSMGQTVGSYAGKGFLAGNDGHFSFESKDYGMLFLVYSIVPHVGYFQGAERGTLYKGKLDFWTPEFDGLGNRAIAKAELFQPMQDVGNGISYFGDTFKGIFGFTPQYAEDKVSRDVVSGDYRLATRSAAGQTSDAWHLMRDVSNDFNTSSDIVHSINFMDSKLDRNDYNRIFQYTSSDYANHFFVHFFFGYSINSPQLPLFDNFDFEEEGKKIAMHINGARMD